MRCLDWLIAQKEADPNPNNVDTWKWLKSMVAMLGVDRMSSDNSKVDRRTGHKVLVSRFQPWQCAMDNEIEIINKLRDDSNADMFTKQGSVPVIRKRDGNKAT